jgi:hypothetical protein
LIDPSSNATVWTRTIPQIAYAQQHPSASGPVARGDIVLRQFAAAPDGSTLAIDIGNLSTGTVMLYNLRTGAAESSISEPSSGGLGYLDHGRWLVVTANSPAPTAQLYDAATLQPFGVPMPTDEVDEEQLAVDPAGTRFAQSISADNATPLGNDPLLWNADPAGWVQTACRIAGRNLTQAEWHQYLPDRTYRATCPGWPAGD